MLSIQLQTQARANGPLWTQWRTISGNVPMRQPEWLMTWWETYTPAGADLFLVCIYDDDRLVGLAPWYRLRSEREVRTLGDGVVCTDYCGVLCAPDQEPAALHARLADWLMDHEPIGIARYPVRGLPARR